jgi:Mg/Co/Ni transporter MgtE
VSRILASYDLVSVPVVDEKHRLVGVVTIDDVLDYLLPDDWRSHPEEAEVGRRAAARAQLTTGSIPIPHGRRAGDGTR